MVGRVDRRLGRMEVLKERYLLPQYLRTFIAVAFASKAHCEFQRRNRTLQILAPHVVRSYTQALFGKAWDYSVYLKKHKHLIFM